MEPTKDIQNLAPITLTSTCYPGYPELDFAVLSKQPKEEEWFKLFDKLYVDLLALPPGDDPRFIIDADKYADTLKWLNAVHWFNDYSNPHILDGSGAELVFPFHRGGFRRISFINHYPPEYFELKERLGIRNEYEEEDEEEDGYFGFGRTEGQWFAEFVKESIFSIHRIRGQYEYLLAVDLSEIRYYNPEGIAYKKLYHYESPRQLVEILKQSPLSPPVREDQTFVRLKEYRQSHHFHFGPGTDTEGMQKILSRFLPPSCVRELID